MNYDLSNVGDAGSLEPINSEKLIKSENSEKIENFEKSEKNENPEKNVKTEKNENTEKNEKTEDSRDSQNLQNQVLKLLKLATSILSGETIEEELTILLDAASAAEAIRNARIEGEIAGRNAAIEEKMIPKPVGIPDLYGTPNLSHRPTSSIFDLAKTAK